MKRATLEAWIEARRARRPIVMLTWLESGRQRLVQDPDALESKALAEAARQALATDRATSLQIGSETVFVQPDNPRVRLFIVGAVHVAQHLTALAIRLEADVTVIDPRTAFASPARFPGVELSHDWPDVALDAHSLDARSAVVTLSHDPKLDDPALDRALRSDAFYIGALGSRRTQASRRDRLRSLGFGAEAIDRVHGPVGLDLGARSPAEIALSIAAEMIGLLRGRSLR
ncbi:MAG: XdhC family protein [bacterium]